MKTLNTKIVLVIVGTLIEKFFKKIDFINEDYTKGILNATKEKRID